MFGYLYTIKRIKPHHSKLHKDFLLLIWSRCMKRILFYIAIAFQEFLSIYNNSSYFFCKKIIYLSMVHNIQQYTRSTSPWVVEPIRNRKYEEVHISSLVFLLESSSSHLANALEYFHIVRQTTPFLFIICKSNLLGFRY